MSIADLLPAWLRTPVLPVAWGKEWHALAPFWLLSLVAAFGVAAQADFPVWLVILVLTNGAIGASAVGHEFGHRTFEGFLAQPLTRAQLWRRKQGVVAVALATGTAPVLLRLLPGPWDPGWGALLIGLGAILSGVCVAPWLTLLTRSTLAGTVFTPVLPAALWAGSALVSQFWFGSETWDDDQRQSLAVLIFAGFLVAHWVVGGIGGWRVFRRIEALDDRGGSLHLPCWRWGEEARGLGGRAVGGGWARWMLRKELRLQQISFLVAGVCVGFWGVWTIGKVWRPGLSLDPLVFGAPVYTVFISLLLGALACAEERQFGTLEGQLILPVSTRRQWGWKLGVVYGLALGLGVGLPAVLRLLTPFEDLRRGAFELAWGDWLMAMVPTALLAAGAALYASSVCRATIRALLVSLLLASVFSIPLVGLRENVVLGWLVSLFGPLRWEAPFSDRVLAVALAVLLGFAAGAHGWANYRTVERRFSRVLRHLLYVFGYGAGLVGAYIAWGSTLGWLTKDQPEPPAQGSIAEPLPTLARASRATFSNRDWLDPTGFARRLKELRDPVSRFIEGRLASETRRRLADYGGTGPVPDALQIALLQDLNGILRGELIYEPGRFEAVQLRPLLREAAGHLPEAETVVFLNRMLIEDGFPTELRRAPFLLRQRLDRAVANAGAGQGESAVARRKEPTIEVRVAPPDWRMGMITGGASSSNLPRMDVQMMRRYGLLPPSPAAPTNRAQ